VHQTESFNNGEIMSFAITALSPENRLSDGLRELDCSASSFAKIADLPGTSVSLALSGHTPFTNERGLHAMRVLSELRELAASAGVPVSYANPNAIRQLLDERRRLSRVPPPHTAFNVRIGDYFFVEKTKFTGLVTCVFASMAPRLSRSVADAVSAELKRQGHERVEVCPNPTGAGGPSFETLFGLEERPVDPNTIQEEYEAQ
jgi:hypothetical protein